MGGAVTSAMRWPIASLLLLLGASAAGCDVLFGVDPGGGGADGAVGTGDGPGGLDAEPGGDEDGDGVANEVDNCPDASNPGQADEDGDDRGDACDACPHVSTATEADTDLDGVGDPCDPDPQMNDSRWYVFEGFDPAPQIDCPKGAGTSGDPSTGWACQRGIGIADRPEVQGGQVHLGSSGQLALVRTGGLIGVQSVEAGVADMDPAPPDGSMVYLEVALSSAVVVRCGIMRSGGGIMAFRYQGPPSGGGSTASRPAPNISGRIRLTLGGNGLRCHALGTDLDLSSAVALGGSVAIGVSAWAMNVPFVAVVERTP